MSDEVWKREVDNKLISHDKDIHSIAKSVQSIDESVKKLADIHVKQAVRDEKFESKIQENKDIAVRAHQRIDAHDKDKKTLVWLFIVPVLTALLGTVVYKEQANSQTSEHLEALTRAVGELAKTQND